VFTVNHAALLWLTAGFSTCFAGTGVAATPVYESIHVFYYSITILSPGIQQDYTILDLHYMHGFHKIGVFFPSRIPLFLPLLAVHM
jgi:hypothetical protein